MEPERGLLGTGGWLEGTPVLGCRGWEVAGSRWEAVRVELVGRCIPGVQRRGMVSERCRAGVGRPQAERRLYEGGVEEVHPGGAEGKRPHDCACCVGPHLELAALCGCWHACGALLL